MALAAVQAKMAAPLPVAMKTCEVPRMIVPSFRIHVGSLSKLPHNPSQAHPYG